MAESKKTRISLDHHFEEWSKTYETSLQQRFFFDPMQESLLRAVRMRTKPKIILDIGCGTGRLLRKIEERWPKAKLIGVDSSNGMIEQARKLTPDAKFYTGTAESLPLPDSSVDIALSTASFHHWSDKQKGVCEVVRVLRHGGQFYLADIQILSLMAKFSAFFDPKGGHARENTLSNTKEMFHNAGLSIQFQKASFHNFEIAGKKQ